MMDARDAYERRAARLALLLTDDVQRGSDALAVVFRAHRDLARVGETMVERAIVQACRAQGRGSGGVAPPPGDDPGAALWKAAHTLEGQPWEAWILRELEGETELLVARAMDCSKTAIATVHLGPAVESVRAAIAPHDYDAALASLRAALDQIDIAPVLAAGRAARDRAIRRSRMVGALQLVALGICFGLMTYVLLDLMQASARERDQHLREDAFSNPIPGTGDDGAGP